ncbi:MAG: DUF3891 family protein, partial [Ginsengibacter sp.]
HKIQLQNMIVTYKEDGWHVVTQRSHGILAAQICTNWQVKDRPERWIETIIAIAEHDDAEVELDGENVLTPQGGPLNYDMKIFDLAHCEKLSTLTQTKNRYIALLTSLHMEFLYREEAVDNSVCRNFLKSQASLQDKWRKELKITEAESLRIYNLMEWCDAFSLLLCQNRLQPEKRKLEISTGPDKKMYYLLQISDETITVDPWPFKAKNFKVTFEYRVIKQLQFGSSADFRKAFLEAPVTEQIWNVSKQVSKKKKAKV